MKVVGDEQFDIAITMETLEHVPPKMVDGYLNAIAQCTSKYVFITVPNEKGIVFLGKWLAKRLLIRDAQRYSYGELVNATLGRLKHVSRNEHKGFDYEQLIGEVSRHFEIVHVSGHPFGILPTCLCFGVGIIAKPRMLSAAPDQSQHSNP